MADKTTFQYFFSYLFIFSTFLLKHAYGTPKYEIIKTFPFDVKPGGQHHEYVEELNGFSCKFDYKSQGGTNEKWAMTIGESKDKTFYSCSVDRPDGRSYLFFIQFRLSVKGASVSNGIAKGDNGSPLRTEEYFVDRKKNEVHHQDGTFRSHLTQVYIDAKRPHEDL